MSDLEKVLPRETRVELVGDDPTEVTVKLWAWPLAKKLAPIVGRMFSRAGDVTDTEMIILESLEDAETIVCETVGWERAKLTEVPGEDVLSIAMAIFDLNVLRTGPDGKPGGVVGKFLALGGVQPKKLLAKALLQQAALDQRAATTKTNSPPKPSPTSSPKATTPEASTDTPSNS